MVIFEAGLVMREHDIRQKDERQKDEKQKK